MRLRYTVSARLQLRSIFDFIAARNPAAARRILAELQAAARRLLNFPLSGRAGQKPGTRELVVLGTPYLIVYEFWPTEDEIAVLAVLHGAQDRSADEPHAD
jgi:plasmid stabilization system protein ParE